MKGWKTFVFFGAVTLLGLVTVFDAEVVTNVILPVKCHLDPAALPTEMDATAKACYEDVVKLAGAIMVGVGVVGKALRFITSTAIFKPE